MSRIRVIQPPLQFVYTATGAEGTSVNFALQPNFIPGAPIRLLTRNTLVLIPTASLMPASDQYHYNLTTTVTFGTPLIAGEIIQIVQL